MLGKLSSSATAPFAVANLPARTVKIADQSHRLDSHVTCEMIHDAVAMSCAVQHA